MPLPQVFGNDEVERTAERFRLRETEDARVSQMRVTIRVMGQQARESGRTAT
jgi:hypothetical protein